MRLKDTKNVLSIAAVVVALMSGTVLLGNYTNILSARSDTDSQPTACQAKASACSATKACSAEKAECGSVAKTCPADASKACCAESGDCPKTACEEGCTKPCCAGEAKEDCCPKSDASAAKTGCCPKIAAVTE